MNIKHRTPRRRPLRGRTRLLDRMDQRQGFLAILRRLPGPQSGNVTAKEWAALSGVYRGLKTIMAPDLWKATWAEAKEYRTGLRPEKATSELARAFVLYQQHADHQRAIWAKETGYNAERERRRRAKDPEGYRQKNTDRRRNARHAAKARSQAALLAQAAPEPANDQSEVTACITTEATSDQGAESIAHEPEGCDAHAAE